MRVRRGNSIGESALTSVSVRRIPRKRFIEHLGVEYRYSGHSLRIEAAMSLARRGASPLDQRGAGRWRLPSMTANYTRGELAVRSAVARLRYGES